MSVYTILTTPTMIYDGSQGKISVKNQGPSTVYLDSQSSVSPDNGRDVQAGSTVLWDQRTPLWAVTKYNQCRLNVNPVGMVTDEIVTSAQRLIAEYVNNAPAITHNITSFECAQYNTLMIRMLSATVGDLYFTFTLTWYDDSNNFLLMESVTAERFTPGILSVNVPAKGSYCQMIVTSIGAVRVGSSPTAYSMDSFRVYGSTRQFNLIVQNASITQVSGGNTYSADRGFIYYDGSALSAPLPSWGNILDITVIGSAGSASILDAVRGTTYGAITVSGGIGSGTLLVPSARPIMVSGTVTGSIAISWRDYV